jgi:hypothetical protein
MIIKRQLDASAGGREFVQRECANAFGVKDRFGA